MKKIKTVIAAIVLLQPLCGFAQLLYNNGGLVHVNPGAIVQINGSAENANTGTLTNHGDITITGDITNNATAGGNGDFHVAGDWINNDVFNSGSGSVELNGAAQFITGTQSTSFYDLLLTGTDTKSLGINTQVTNLLALNNRELATDVHTLFFTSNAPAGITRTSGFVSSLAGGTLSRATAAASVYLFPVGSSLGTLRYRPVNISPATNSAHTYTVRMVNNDATTDGYNRSNTDSTICTTNPDFYYMINRSSGGDAADIGINFDPIADGSWDRIANWKTAVSQWQTLGTANTVSNFVIHNAWNDFTNEPYLLTNYKANATIEPVNPVCANNAEITLQGFDPGGIWSGSGITDSLTGAFDPSLAGEGGHEIWYVIPGVCGDSASVTVHVHAVASLNAVVTDESCIDKADGVIDLTVTGGASPFSYLWDNSLPPAEDQTELGPGIYIVVVTDSNNCSVTQSYTVLAGTGECFPETFYIPNIFSPNGDNINDMLYVRGNGIKTMSLLIYDRWGEKVFESSEQTSGWDGTFNGTKMDAGVFVYYLEAEMNSGKTYKLQGSISLVR